jgi:acyl-CoA dehydrogenase
MGGYLFEADEHRKLRQEARRWATSELRPHALAWDTAGEFPRELYAKAAAAGLLGVGYPEEYAGSGGDLSHVIVASEEMILAGHSVGAVVGLGSHGIALPPILRFGSEEQKKRFVKPVLEGKLVSALAITEPGGGSDVAHLSTKAVRDGDHYIVKGEKAFITSGCRADFVVAAVRTGGAGHAGISLLILESDRPGFSVSRKLDKMGWRASDTAILSFDDLRVPVSNLVGPENAGFFAIMTNFGSERLYLAAQCVAIAELAYRETVAYAKAREAFGKPLTGHQVIRHKLADMASRIAGARALTGELAVRMTRGEAVPGLAAMTKNVATDACSFVCDEAVQIHGAYGYMRETLVERLYRDARLYPIGGGTREIMNEIIGKTEGY